MSEATTGASSRSDEPVRIGVRLPSTGPGVAEAGVPALSARLEQAGFDSLWVTDHVVMTTSSDRSHYPFADDGRIGWDRTGPVHDAVVVMAQATAATTHVEVGSAVLVLPQRHPVVLAKQVATLDDLSGGRIALGIGVGWYREEFEALNVDFDARGAIFDEWVAILRACWTGRPGAVPGEHHTLPAGVIHEPTPRHHVPLLVGGVSDVALRRAARQGDGWLGLQRVSRLDPDEVASHVRRLHDHRSDADDGPPPRIVLRIIESAGHDEAIAAALPALARAGVDDVVVDVDVEGDVAGVHERLADGADVG